MAFQPLSLSSPRPVASSSTLSSTPASMQGSKLSNSGAISGTGAGAGDITSPQELVEFVDTMLNDLEARFETMSEDVIGRLGSISTRIDALESSIADIMSGGVGE